MVNITNNHKAPLGLPGGIVLAPGVKTPVPNWHAIKDNHIVAAWVRNRILTVEGADAPVPQSVTDAVADEKDSLIAQLAALGIKKDKRTSLENLRTALSEAQG
ncbi:hypothetical protein [Panacagrimonas sp.]|uniref:hypothetical protein n=1 Tax=Panacagrimonas sp. TaxID=2480088 RepID=UPI003B522F4B